MITFKRHVARIAYHLRNFGLDAAPQFFFRTRLRKILGKIGDKELERLVEDVSYYNKLVRCFTVSPRASPIARIPMARSRYYYDLKEYARYFDRGFKIDHVFGDVTHVPQVPSIVKSRPIEGNNRNSVVLNLDKLRHFHFEPDERGFTEKRPMAVWRGGLNNRARRELVRRYRGHSLCDIGHTSPPTADLPRSPRMSIGEQLGFRYIISVEGVDVATNLKWIMASNSLCLMPPPRYETWFMEGQLVPGIHYAPLRPDFEDLEERILYFERHPLDAREIIRNANAHWRKTSDRRREQLISLLVLCKYFMLSRQMGPQPFLESLLLPET